jgi:hypothetical protein
MVLGERTAQHMVRSYRAFLCKKPPISINGARWDFEIKSAASKGGKEHKRGPRWFWTKGQRSTWKKFHMFSRSPAAQHIAQGHRLFESKPDSNLHDWGAARFEIDGAAARAAKDMQREHCDLERRREKKREEERRREKKREEERRREKKREEHMLGGPMDFQNFQRHHSSLPGFLILSPARRKSGKSHFEALDFFLRKRQAPHGGCNFCFWDCSDFSLHVWRSLWFEIDFVEERREEQTSEVHGVFLEKEERRTHGFEPIVFWKEWTKGVFCKEEDYNNGRGFIYALGRLN